MFNRYYSLSVLYIIDEICRDDTITLTDVKPDPKKANPKVGPSQIAFSADNRYVFSRNGRYSYKCIAKGL